MATTYTKLKLSGSTSGRGILVAATATTGTTIHATGTSSTDMDEVWLYAQNNHTADIVLTIEYGGTTSPNDLITVTVPFKSGISLIVPGLLLLGTGNATTITAFAATTNKISIFGYVNRISP